MAEPDTVARPYAEAVFKLADAEHELGRWADMLAALAQVVTDERVRRIIADPNVPEAKVAGLLRKVHVDALNLRSQHHVCGKAVFLACFRRELTRRILVQEHHELRGRPRSADGLPGCCFTRVLGISRRTQHAQRPNR